MRTKKASKTPKRGRRPSGEPSGKDALLHAATASFAEFGFRRSDLRTIAKAAGVNASLALVCFGSKEGLWNACVESVALQGRALIALLEQIASGDGTVKERLTQVIFAGAKFNATHPEVRLFLTQSASEDLARAERLVQEFVLPLYTTLLPLITAAIKAGVVKAKYPAPFFSILINSLSWQKAVPALINRLAPDIAPEDFAELIASTAVSLFLHDPAK